MKTFKKRVYFVVWAVIIAYGHLLISQIIFWNVAGGNVLTASIWHMCSIIVFLLYDKIATYIHSKIKPKNKDIKPNVFRRILDAYLGGSSFKTGLYLFYIGILALTAINAAEPVFFDEMVFIQGMVFNGDYLLSVEYGILILVAADTFLAHLTKDMNES